jgi:16S rRNA (guanine527-N7)-methyltransferase
VSFADELRQLLPDDLPFREECVAGASRHLDLIVEANRHFNLTRIVNPREAAIKHVVDSVLPWRLFRDASDSGRRVGRRLLVFRSPWCCPRRATLLESTQKRHAS